jgi:6-phosphogluconolactonase (cycloisomerase 2 family)
VRGLALLATAIVAVAAPASAQAAGNAYVTNVASPGIVRGFDYGSAGLLAPMAPASAGAVNDSRHVAVTPDGRHLYVTGLDGSGGGAVSIYDLSPSGVPIPNPGSPAGAGSGPFGLTVSADGRSLYVANAGDPETISQYDITPSGGLTPKSPAVVPLPGTGSRQIALTPDGRNAYVIHSGSGGVSQWTVDDAGRLLPKTPLVVGSQTLHIALAITPDGRDLYVPVGAENSIYQYDIAADGTLAPKVPPTVPASGQQQIAIAPDGRSVYAGNNGFVEQFDVGSGGALVPKSPPFAVSPGSGAGFMAVAPDSRSLYVTGGQSGPNPTLTFQFDVAPDGKLSQKSPSSATSSSGPGTLGIAVRPAQAPTASFAADTAPAGSATAFDATESRDPNGGSISRYDWDFGDGSTAPDGGATPTHVYGAPGNYTVTLRVTGTGGCNATVFTGQATLCNGAPSARARSVAVGAAPGGGGAGGAGNPATEPVRPGFTVVSRRALSKGRVQLTLRPSVPGRFAATATMRRGRKRVTYGKGKATARTAAELKLTIKPGAAGRAALRRTRSLRLSIKLAFTPASNTTPSSSTSATVRGTGRR